MRFYWFFSTDENRTEAVFWYAKQSNSSPLKFLSQVSKSCFDIEERKPRFEVDWDTNKDFSFIHFQPEKVIWKQGFYAVQFCRIKHLETH